METPEPIDVASLRAIGSHITDAAADEIERLRRENVQLVRELDIVNDARVFAAQESDKRDRLQRQAIVTLEQKLKEVRSGDELSRELKTVYRDIADDRLREIVRLETDGAWKTTEIVCLNVALLAAWCGVPWVGLPSWIAAAACAGLRLWRGRKRA